MRSKFCGSVEGLVGNTPLIRLARFSAKGCASVFAKLDFFNPGFSVKDRVVLNMIRDAENRGALKEGDTLIECSSGNTAVSMAVIGAAKGYRVTVVMPDFNGAPLKERLKRLGARVVLTPEEKGIRGAKEKVAELCGKNRNYHHLDQFNNSSNPEIHRNTTAKEIMKGMGDGRIDAFVAGVGTGGTITGVGEMLKSRYPDMKIYAVEPAESPVLSGGKAGVHYINGIGAGFVPPLLNRDIMDSVITVSSEQAEDTCGRLASKEGLLAGMSSGAVYWAALKVASKMKRESNVVAFFADAMAGA